MRICVQCFNHPPNDLDCLYDLGHLYDEPAEVQPKQVKKIDVNLCLLCGLHAKNPVSKMSSCAHQYPNSSNEIKISEPAPKNLIAPLIKRMKAEIKKTSSEWNFNPSKDSGVWRSSPYECYVSLYKDKWYASVFFVERSQERILHEAKATLEEAIALAEASVVAHAQLNS